MAAFRGRLLLDHAADALRQIEPDVLVAVAASEAVKTRLGGFDAVTIRDRGHTQSESLRAGIARAKEFDADRALVVLADMPFVTAPLLEAVLAKAGPDQLSAATDGARRMPPACFPRSAFPALLALDGDRGAGALLGRLPEHQLVRVPQDHLIDIDHPDDLIRAEEGLSGRSG